MKQILAVVLLIFLMSGIASAELVEEWPHEQRNVMPDYIEGVMYDFEEGSNCVDFKNQFPEIATFLTVIGTQPYGTSDWPSYVTVGGSTCGNTRCYMRIYPWCGYYPNGTPYEYVFVVNGRSAFSPMTGPDHMGGFWPGMKTHIVFKEDTRFVSFLATTSGNMYVTLFDRHGDRICSEKITVTILREGTNPSNFTQFSYHSANTDIVSMKISGPFNGNHIDDLIIGGAPGYLPTEPVNYTYVAQRAQELYGVDYLEYGLGHDYVIMDYMDPWQFKDSALEEYWNPETKQFELGEGISNPGLVVWAYNYDAMELADTRFVKWSTVDGMAKQDFTVPVDPSDIQPGDVYFMDRDFDSKNTPDEVGMVVEETNGMNLITACPDSNKVVYSKSSIVESSPAFLGYFRLPGVIKGGHNPIPKGH